MPPSSLGCICFKDLDIVWVILINFWQLVASRSIWRAVSVTCHTSLWQDGHFRVTSICSLVCVFLVNDCCLCRHFCLPILFYCWSWHERHFCFVLDFFMTWARLWVIWLSEAGRVAVLNSSSLVPLLSLLISSLFHLVIAVSKVDIRYPSGLQEVKAVWEYPHCDQRNHTISAAYQYYSRALFNFASFDYVQPYLHHPIYLMGISCLVFPIHLMLLHCWMEHFWFIKCLQRDD